MFRPTVAVLALCSIVPAALAGQKVMIKGATSSDVVRAINTELSTQGFKLEDSTKNEARFGLDRGLLNQNTANGVQSVPVVLELHLRFKQKEEGLEVTAYEEVVGSRGRGSMEFRKPVRSHEEVAGMQQLLDLIKSDLEARGTP
jgi:hypothetical protein